MALGVYSGVKRGGWQDRAAMVFAVSGISFPRFWLGLLLIDLFSVRLGWLPTGGYGGWQSLRHAGVYARQRGRGRDGPVHPLGLCRGCRRGLCAHGAIKGVPERGVIWTHTLRNALIPVITLTGLQFGFLLGGAIVVETVFSWPGLGRLLIDSVSFRDYPVIQAEILLFAFEFVLINLIVDLLYGVVNPEIRLR